MYFTSCTLISFSLISLYLEKKNKVLIELQDEDFAMKSSPG